MLNKKTRVLKTPLESVLPYQCVHLRLNSVDQSHHEPRVFRHFLSGRFVCNATYGVGTKVSTLVVNIINLVLKILLNKHEHVFTVFCTAHCKS